MLPTGQNGQMRSKEIDINEHKNSAYRNVSVAHTKSSNIGQFAQVPNLHFAFSATACQIVTILGKAN
jgi:hypothetical protein